MNNLNALFLLLLIVVFPAPMMAQICDPYEPYTDGCTDDIGDRYDYIDFPEILLDGNNGITEFHNSCVSHDYCYQVIGNSQSECDNDFHVDMVDSCEDRYLRFEAYRIIGFEEVLKTGLFCSVLGIPHECTKWVTEEIWGWVEVSRELAERTIELPKFPICMDYASVYYQAVVIAGKKGYDAYQRRATYHAEQLARSQQSGECSSYVSPSDSNLFTSDNNMVAVSLYNNFLNRSPSTSETSAIQNIQSEDPEWQYTLTNTLSDQRVAIFVPIINLILL